MAGTSGTGGSGGFGSIAGGRLLGMNNLQPAVDAMTRAAERVEKALGSLAASAASAAKASAGSAAKATGATFTATPSSAAAAVAGVVGGGTAKNWSGTANGGSFKFSGLRVNYGQGANTPASTPPGAASIGFGGGNGGGVQITSKSGQLGNLASYITRVGERHQNQYVTEDFALYRAQLGTGMGQSAARGGFMDKYLAGTDRLDRATAANNTLSTGAAFGSTAWQRHMGVAAGVSTLDPSLTMAQSSAANAAVGSAGAWYAGMSLGINTRPGGKQINIAQFARQMQKRQGIDENRKLTKDEYATVYQDQASPWLQSIGKMTYLGEDGQQAMLDLTQSEATYVQNGGKADKYWKDVEVAGNDSGAARAAKRDLEKHKLTNNSIDAIIRKGAASDNKNTTFANDFNDGLQQSAKALEKFYGVLNKIVDNQAFEGLPGYLSGAASQWANPISAVGQMGRVGGGLLSTGMQMYGAYRFGKALMGARAAATAAGGAAQGAGAGASLLSRILPASLMGRMGTVASLGRFARFAKVGGPAGILASLLAEPIGSAIQGDHHSGGFRDAAGTGVKWAGRGAGWGSLVGGAIGAGVGALGFGVGAIPGAALGSSIGAGVGAGIGGVMGVVKGGFMDHPEGQGGGDSGGVLGASVEGAGGGSGDEPYGRSVSQVLAYAASQANNPKAGGWYGRCQSFARQAIGAHGGAATATQGWNQAHYKHPGDRSAPAGALLYWSGGNAGHAAISAGNGMVYSTDVRRRGHVDLVSFNEVNKWLGSRHRYLGWTEDTNGTRVRGLGQGGGAAPSTGANGDTSTGSAGGSTGSAGGSTGSAGAAGGGWAGGSTSEADNVAAALAGGGASGAAAGTGVSSVGAATSSDSTSSGADSSGSAGSLPKGGTPAKNAALGKTLAAQLYHWAGREWNALNWVVMNESGWNNKAQNPGSTAYGIFQFLNGTWAGTGYKKTSDPETQIRAGLKYVKNRYHDPIGAQSYWKKYHSYDKGAWQIEQDETARVHKDEMIVPAKQANTIRQALLQENVGGTDPTGKVAKGKSGSGVTINFGKGSVVFQVSGTVTEETGRAAARGFVKALQDNKRIENLGKGL